MEVSDHLLAKADEFEAQAFALQEMVTLLREAADELNDLKSRLGNAEITAEDEFRRRLKAEEDLEVLRYEARRVEFLN